MLRKFLDLRAGIHIKKPAPQGKPNVPQGKPHVPQGKPHVAQVKKLVLHHLIQDGDNGAMIGELVRSNGIAAMDCPTAGSHLSPAAKPSAATSV